ncbi:MAG: zinc-binding dehydrogenase [Acidimicrobiales bacterium]
MRAAVVRSPNELSIEDIDEPEAPGPGEVLVRMVATGICHTDLSILRGNIPVPLPVVLGHEGAGVVEAVGLGVTDVAVGDHVVASIVVSCGSCFQCLIGNLPLCETGSQVAFGGTMMDGTTRLHKGSESMYHIFCQSSFAEYAVVPSRAVVPISRDVPLDKVAVLGCGAMTGIGAVTRRARVPAGSSVVVVGVGGVGLSAVMGARAAGASTIIAIDVSDAALGRAKDLGATHTVNSTTDDPSSAVLSITARGADFAFDAVGTGDTLEQAFQTVRPGGDVVLIGLMHLANTVSVDMFSLLLQKRLTGTYAGSIVPRTDIPEIIALYLDGRLPLDKLVSASYKLDQLDQAFKDMEAGKVGRGVVIF